MATIVKVKNAYRVQIRRAGMPSISKNFTKKADAERWARSKEVELDAGHRPDLQRRLTIGDLMDRCIAEDASPISPQRKGLATLLRQHFGGLRLENLTKRHIIDFGVKRFRAGIGPSTINYNLSSFRSFLRNGAMFYEVDEAVELALIRAKIATRYLRDKGMVAESNERDRRPTPAELLRLRDIFLKFEANRPNAAPMWDIILFSVATSFRVSETCRIARSGLNHQDRTVLITDRKHPRKKRGNNKTVALLRGPFVFDGVVIDPYEILMRQRPRQDDPDRFFPFASTMISETWYDHVHKEIDNLHFHDLRHEGVSRMFEYGYAIQQVAMVSGHEDWKSLKRYTNLRAADLHDFNANAHQSSAHKSNTRINQLKLAHS
jgi:site-specific recombinase XerD